MLAAIVLAIAASLPPTLSENSVGNVQPRIVCGLRDVVINTVYILSGTNALCGGHFAVCRRKYCR